MNFRYGGHAPGHVRTAFLDLTGGPYTEADSAFVGDVELPARSVSSMLLGCTDIMPALDCGDLGLPRGSTYDCGAKVMLALLDGKEPRDEYPDFYAGE